MDKRKNKNGTTLDDLANMIAVGFEHAATKEEMNERFNEVNQRFNEVNQRIGKIDYRVDEVYDILARFEEGDILDLQKRIAVDSRPLVKV